MISGFARWWGVLGRSLHRRGLGGTVRYGFTLVSFRAYLALPRAWRDLPGIRFDRKFGVQTHGNIGEEAYREGADLHWYEPTPFFIARRTLRVLPIEYGEFTFLDLGCGKGRVLLLASDLPFRRIVGIDMSPALVEVAESNIAKYRNNQTACTNFQLMCADVRDFKIPDGNLVLYFCNPFGNQILCDVLENVRHSVAELPRQVFLIFTLVVPRHVTDHLPFLSLVRDSAWYRIYRVVQSGPSTIHRRR